MVHKSNTDFGYNPKIASTQRLLVFSIPSKIPFMNIDDANSALLRNLVQGGNEYELS